MDAFGIKKANESTALVRVLRVGSGIGRIVVKVII